MPVRFTVWECALFQLQNTPWALGPAALWEDDFRCVEPQGKLPENAGKLPENCWKLPGNGAGNARQAREMPGRHGKCLPDPARACPTPARACPIPLMPVPLMPVPLMPVDIEMPVDVDARRH